MIGDHTLNDLGFSIIFQEVTNPSKNFIHDPKTVDSDWNSRRLLQEPPGDEVPSKTPPLAETYEVEPKAKDTDGPPTVAKDVKVSVPKLDELDKTEMEIPPKISSTTTTTTTKKPPTEEPTSKSTTTSTTTTTTTKAPTSTTSISTTSTASSTMEKSTATKPESTTVSEKTTKTENVTVSTTPKGEYENCQPADITEIHL